jgi:hypothetical protein
LANINDEKYLKQFLDYSKLRKSCWSWHLLGQSRSKSSDLRRKTNPKKVALQRRMDTRHPHCCSSRFF